MSTAVHWKQHSTLPEQCAGDYRAQWNRLNQHWMTGRAMLHSMFVDGLLRHFAPGQTVLAVGEQDAQAAALLPNARPGLGVRGCFLHPQAQIGPALLWPQGDLRSLLRALAGYTTQLDLLYDAPRFCKLRTLPDSPVQSLPHVPTMRVSMQRDLDANWAQRPFAFHSNADADLLARFNHASVYRHQDMPALNRLTRRGSGRRASKARWIPIQ